jgi:hypothetical protein
VAPVFSKARKAQIREGSLVRYLKYAIGEIILIVLGILIALQISDWYQARQDRQLEYAYLTSLQRDLADDVADLTFAIEGNGQLISGVGDLLDLLTSPVDDKAYQRSLYLHTLKFGYWFMTMEFSDLTVAQLKSGDGLRLITDQPIKQSILRYEKGVDSVEQQYEQMYEYFHTLETSQKALFNQILSREAFDFIEVDFLNMLKPLETFDALVPDGEYIISDDPRLWTTYYGDALYYKTALNTTNLLLIRQLDLAEALTELISDRYGINPN